MMNLMDILQVKYWCLGNGPPNGILRLAEVLIIEIIFRHSKMISALKQQVE
jgi:hypothetical protein